MYPQAASFTAFSATDACGAQRLCPITVDVSQEICGNGGDDDGDGDADCADADCAASPACVPTTTVVTTSTTSSTTTTTPTQPSATTTTTTSSTSTTVPPTSCGPPAPTFASIVCRTDALRMQAQATVTGPLSATLSKGLAKGSSRLAKGRQRCADSAKGLRPARAGLQKLHRRLLAFSRRITSLTGRRAVPSDVAAALLQPARALDADVLALRASVACPAAR